jgi:ribosomal protein S15P/S13E
MHVSGAATTSASLAVLSHARARAPCLVRRRTESRIRRTHAVRWSPFVDGALRPRLVATPAFGGDCFNGSFAVHNAYRCIDGDFLRDPCFADLTRDEVVVCVRDPFSRGVVRLQDTTCRSWIRRRRAQPVCHDRHAMTVDTPSRAGVSPPADRRKLTTLYRRLFVSYAAVLTLALLLLIFAPVTISVPVTLAEVAVLLIGFAAMLGAFHLLLHRGLDPLEQLTAVMERIDPLAPGQRIQLDAPEREVAALTEAFNDMLDRLESERRDSARRALAAQEGERRRIARELHDEIGQVLTGLVLRSETLARRAPDDLRRDLEDLREAARQAAEEVRRIARRLRPEALDELGLQSALLALFTAVSNRVGLRIDRDLERDLPLNAE